MGDFKESLGDVACKRSKPLDQFLGRCHSSSFLHEAVLRVTVDSAVNAGVSFGLVRHQCRTTSSRLWVRIEYAGFGSGFGLSLDLGWDGRILGVFYILGQQYQTNVLFNIWSINLTSIVQTWGQTHVGGFPVAITTPKLIEKSICFRRGVYLD